MESRGGPVALTPGIAFLIAATFVLLSCLVSEPRWETNDDIAMSMLAHGYGLAESGSAKLIFSNVLWGYLVRAIPEIHGVLGYSWATLASLVAAATAFVWGLRQMQWTWVTAALVMSLVMARPVWFPQFTLNAGLLTVAAVLAWHAHARCAHLGSLALGCLMAFAGFLIRAHEFLFVMLVAAPFLPWQNLRSQRSAQIAAALLLAATLIAGLIDLRSYASAEWQPFLELNSPRAQFTDFHAAQHLLDRPELLVRQGFSFNDVDLIANWFFVDPRIADPVRLKALLAELGPLPMQAGSLRLALQSVKELAQPALVPLLAAALALGLVLPSRRIWIAWGVFLAAVAGLGLLGRPGVMRVLIPAGSLLVIAPLLSGPRGDLRSRHFAHIILFIACVLNFGLVWPQVISAQANTKSVRQAVAHFQREAVVAWGSAFPYEEVYPVLSDTGHERSLRLYALTVFTLAPSSVAAAESAAGHGMIPRLVSETGIPVIAHAADISRLRRYCHEHLDGTLIDRGEDRYGPIIVRQLRCDSPVQNPFSDSGE